MRSWTAEGRGGYWRDCSALLFGLVSKRTAGAEGIGAAAIPFICSSVVEARRRSPWQH